jgi:hypothetical protein
MAHGVKRVHHLLLLYMLGMRPIGVLLVGLAGKNSAALVTTSTFCVVGELTFSAFSGP